MAATTNPHITKYGSQKSPLTAVQKRSPLFTFSFMLLLVALFALSLTAQLVHHFVCDHAYVMFAFDGKHYLTTSQAMTGALMLLFKGDLSAFFATIGAAAFGKNLVWDGPIIPGIPALFFALAGRLPQESDWSYFAVFFSLLASVSAVLLAVIARILTGSTGLALTAGLLFALYPTTLLATGVYRSEIIAVTLLLTLLLALYKAPQSFSAAVFAGIVGGVFALVKPVMIPAIGLLCLFAGWHGSGKQGAPNLGAGLAARSKLLAILAVAGVLTIAPWSIYTALDCGKLSITCERGPSYNAGVGTDIAADGWCTMPETAHTAQAKLDKSPLTVFVKNWQAKPLELAKLTLRRVTRLWSNPWNDFREPIFALPVAVQIAWHMILVALGFMGLSLFIFFPPQKQFFGGDARLLGNLAAIALLSHLSFIMFQTMGRYAYTSMPLLALFCAYGLGLLHHLVQRSASNPRANFKGTCAAAFGIAFALLIFNCDALTHAGEIRETAHILRPGETAGRSIDLSSQPLLREASVKPTLLLMVDCEGSPADLAALSLSLNGHVVVGPLLPLNCFNGKNYFLFDTMAEHAGYMRTHVQDFRQWRAVLVEPDALVLNKDGINEIQLVNKGKSSVTLFADAAFPSGGKGAEQPLLLPSPDYFASDRMLISLTSKESRINTLAPVAGVIDRSYLRTTEGGTTDARALDDSLRLRLGLGTDLGGASSARENEHSPVAAAVGYDADLNLSLGPKLFHWFARTEDGLRLNKAVLKGVGAVSCDIDLSPLKKSGAQGTQLAITLTGQVRNNASKIGRSNKAPGRLGISAGLTNAQGLYQGLGEFADCVLVPSAGEGSDWTSFTLDDVVPLFRLGGVPELSKLSLSFLPCPRLESCYGAGRQCADLEVKDLHVSMRLLNLTDIAAKNLSVY